MQCHSASPIFWAGAFVNHIQSSMSKLDRLANAAVAIAAVVIAGSFAQQSFGWFGSDELLPPPVATPPFHPEWRSLDSASLFLDRTDGALQLFVFSDIECPFCARFHLQILPALQARYPGEVSVRIVHLPLRSHRFSRQAAVALECAAVQGAAGPFLEAAYMKQDSIGLISWQEYAIAAGVGDSGAFSRCLHGGEHPRIAAGEEASDRFGVSSTPTIIVNGWRFTGIGDSSAFVAAIDSIRIGADPFITAPR